MKVLNKVIKFSVDVLPTFLAGFKLVIDQNCVKFCVLLIFRSKKYEVAVSKDVPIMTSDWILQVWEKSKHDAVHAADPQFSRFVTCSEPKPLIFVLESK